MRPDGDPACGELLADLIGRALLRVPDNPALDDGRYLDWIADELVGEPRRADRRVADAAYLARGHALRVAVHARRLGVTRHLGTPPGRRATVRGTPAAVLGAALAERATPLVDLAVAAGAGRELWDEPCDRWVELPADVAPGRHLALRVRGDSMSPLMDTGDTVLVRLDGTPRAGTVVVARHPDDGYVCKRVRRVTRQSVQLDSLALDGPAFTLPRDPGLVLGTVVHVWHDARARRDR